MAHDRIVNQHQPGLALYPRNLSYDLLPLIGPSGWALLRALHDHADEQALRYRGARPIAPSAEEMQALAGVGEASLLVIKDLLRVCGCLSWEDLRGKQEARPGRRLKQAPTRTVVYYLHPLTGLTVTLEMVRSVLAYAARSERAQAYLKANGLLRPRPAFLPASAWPALLPRLVEDAAWIDLFQRVHGVGAHHAYRDGVLRWLEAAAEVVATLEWERQPLHERDQASVADRAVMVMARWIGTQTVPSWRGHGAPPASHDDSVASPHTPVNERINQPGKGETGARMEGGTMQREGWDGWNQETDGRLQAAAGAEPVAQAEAELWAAVATILEQADAAPGYQPTRSERRQARRLLRHHALDTVLDALRHAVHAYRPAPGQPPAITRFGFAAGLPDFQRALEPAGVPGPQQNLFSLLHGSEDASPGEVQIVEDFWAEYGRVNRRPATRAERRRIEAVAARVDWQQLLIWLDRWERARREPSTELGPGYFETCAAAVLALAKQAPSSVPHPLPATEETSPRAAPRNGAGGETPVTPGVLKPLPMPAGARSRGHSPGLERGPPKPVPDIPAQPAPVSGADDQQHATYARLVELGIHKARSLAQLPATTLALVESWWAAANRAEVKDRRAYVAAGVASGHFPDLPLSSTPPAAPQLPPAPEAPPAGSLAANIWASTLDILQAQLPAEDFETWIRPCTLLEVTETGAIILVPNVFVRQELEQRLHAPLHAALEHAAGYRLELLFVM